MNPFIHFLGVLQGNVWGQMQEVIRTAISSTPPQGNSPAGDDVRERDSSPESRLPMVKLMVMCRRKPGLSLEEFNQHWAYVHGPLMQRLGPALRIKAYVQSRVAESAVLRTFLGDRDADPASIDGIAEGWWENEAELIAGFSSPEGQAANAVLASDERNFCSPGNTAFLAYQYQLIGKPDRFRPVVH